jgi:hypothetical protein
LNTNLCQKIPPPNLPWGFFYDRRQCCSSARPASHFLRIFL